MTEKAGPRFSLIIPAYNEASVLPRLLDTADIARQRYPRGLERIEVVVANNNSTDDTADIARARGCVVTHVEKRAISMARNGGAAVAKGEVLCFVDADSQIHPGTFQAIDRVLRTGKVVAGSTGATLDRWSLGIAVTYMMLMPVVVLTGMDIGVVFCPREHFDSIGGYNEERLFAEDVEFLWNLRRLGRRHGKKLARVTEAKAVVSTRKFDRHGHWHFVTQMPRLAVMALSSRSATNDFARRYWYGDDR